mmetsp:Transcript_82449/g.145484  ORF Transcript_82449/g.145484 Transcript_82449/m.145484 type:complete len:203 (+) Transcript_82449:296-904(+)
MHWSYRTVHDGLVRLVAEGHDVIMLVVLPVHKGLHNTLHVKVWVICLLDQSFGVVGLEANARFIAAIESILGLSPLLPFFVHCGSIWKGDAAEDHISHPPCLCIKHVEGQPLVLHANVKETRVAGPHQALIEGINPEAVCCLQLQIVSHEREVMQVPSAHNDCVNLCSLTILESTGSSVDPLQERNCLEVLGPMKAHWICAP